MALASVLLLLDCSSSTEPTAKSAPDGKRVAASVAQIYGGAEPTVRVELSSIGDWARITLEGKGGLSATSVSGASTKTDAVTIERQPDAAPVTYKARDGVFTIRHGESADSYAGTLVVDHGRLINHLPLENYVLGVLRGELSLPDVPVAAAAALAIAVRSYTLHYLLQDAPVRDLDDTTLFQVYAGLRYASQDKSLRAGVNATRGRYLVWAGAPVKAYYHSTCGGATTDVPTGLNREAIGCMTGVPCDWCRDSKYFTWETTLPVEFVGKQLSLDGNLKTVSVTDVGPGDRAAHVLIETTSGKQYIPGSEFRLRLGGSRLRSTRWSYIELGHGGLFLRGSGWGHGVGLCQMGAIGRAQKGATGENIALAYYTGATIERAY